VQLTLTVFCQVFPPVLRPSRHSFSLQLVLSPFPPFFFFVRPHAYGGMTSPPSDLRFRTDFSLLHLLPPLLERPFPFGAALQRKRLDPQGIADPDSRPL